MPNLHLLSKVSIAERELTRVLRDGEPRISVKPQGAATRHPKPVRVVRSPGAR